MITQKNLLLTCPHCHTDLQKSADKNHVYCHCSKFPIFNNIFYLNKNPPKSLVAALGISKLKYPLFLLFQTIHHTFHPTITHPINLIFFKLLWNIEKNELNYFLKRQFESESLLFFTPLSFTKINSKTIWIDIGSGITNYYDYIEKLSPHTQIYSVDNLFRNLYLSVLFFPRPNTNYFCTDISQINYFHPHSFDIITSIDTIPFVANQPTFIKNMFSLSHSKSIVYASGIFPKIFNHKLIHITPINTSNMNKIINQPIHLIDDIIIAKNINQKNIFHKSQLTTNPIFRYSFIWPKKELPTRFYLPKSLSQHHQKVWIPVNY